MADAVHELRGGFCGCRNRNRDPASVSSVIEWGRFLRERVRHIIVLNKMSDPHSQFSYWHETPMRKRTVSLRSPLVLTLESINPDLQNSLRVHGETIGRVADKKAVAPELHALKWLIRAQAIRRNINAQFDQQLRHALAMNGNGNGVAPAGSNREYLRPDRRAFARGKPRRVSQARRTHPRLSRER